MKVFTRYLLLQIPGFAAVLVAMVLLNRLLGVAGWVGALVIVGWVLKDLALYPLLRPAYERTEHLTPRARMLGERGVVEQALDPSGYVRLRGELWQAESEDRYEHRATERKGHL